MAVTDSEAIATVQAATVWNAVADFKAAFDPWGIVMPCGSGYPCADYSNYTYYDLHRTGDHSVWVSINHFSNMYNPPNPYSKYRVIWRACARDDAAGNLYATDKSRVQGVIKLY